MNSSELESASDAQLKLIMAQANLRLQSQLEFASAADQRAALLTGMAGALAAAFVAVLAQSFGGKELTGTDIVAAVCTAGFSISAFAAMQSAGCQDFHPPGYYPRDFIGDLRSRKSDRKILQEIIVGLNERLEFNSKVLAWRGQRTDQSLSALACTPLIVAVCLGIFLMKDVITLHDVVSTCIIFGGLCVPGLSHYFSEVWIQRPKP